MRAPCPIRRRRSPSPNVSVCYYAPPYNAIGPFGLEIWADTDPNTGRIVAWNIGAFIDKAINTIWMDDRPHPGPNALRTFSGFTTGHWDGNTLVAYMTHFKEGYLRRNGVPISDQTTMTMYITRHGDMLTMLEVIEDPVYLTEPFLVSRNWQLDPTANMTRVPAPCVPEAELPDLKGEGTVAALPAGQESLCRRNDQDVQPAGDRCPRRCRDDVPRVPETARDVSAAENVRAVLLRVGRRSQPHRAEHLVRDRRLGTDQRTLTRTTGFSVS